MNVDIITSEVIRAAFEVHNFLGSGYLEKVYHNALIVELESIGFKVYSEYPINVYYKEKLIGHYVADLFIEESVIVELKAVEEIHPIHEVQLVNYLQATKVEVGLLLNFGRSVEIRKKFRTYKKK
jgi:GxxExxY protein